MSAAGDTVPIVPLPWPAVPVCSSMRSQVIPATSAASVTPHGMPKQQALLEALVHHDLRSKSREGQGRRQTMDRLCSGKPSKGLPCSSRDAQQQAGPQRPQGELCPGAAAAAREILGAGSLQSGFPFPSPGTSTPHPCMGGGCSAEQTAAWRSLCHTPNPREMARAQHTKCITVLQFTALWHHQPRWND